MADVGADDELDYHITFPSPQLQDVTEDDDSTLDININNQQEPVVVLLGWAGCKDKYLSKYSAIYEKRCITIRYTAPPGDIFCNSGSMHTIATKILELISDLQIAENPIFFHVFSNGGGLVYRHITELMHTDPEYKQMRMQGTIFDSCPSKRSPIISAKAYLAATKGRNFIVRYFVAVILLIFLYAKVLIGKILSRAAEYDGFGEALKNDPARCPQLYLYSKADEIVSFVAVEEQINARKALVKVLSVCWDDSGHVSHLRIHRESYIKHCLDFIEMCLKTA